MFEESRIVRKNQPSEPSLITITGESYQPARLYYQVGQKNAVLGRFKRLRCIDYDQSQNRWVWYYTEEAKSLKFNTSYRDIPKEQHPVILGYFTWKGDRELELDLDSFDRVLEAIKFFDQKINRRLAKGTKFKIVNKLFPASTTEEEMSSHHHIFFEQREAVDHEEDMDKLEEISSQYEPGDERHQATFDYMEQQLRKPLPEVEEIENNFYDAGIESVSLTLKMRSIEAVEHWRGNKNFSQFDVMERLLENMAE